MSQQSVQNMYMRMTLQATPGGQADDYRSGPVLPGQASLSSLGKSSRSDGVSVYCGTKLGTAGAVSIAWRGAFSRGHEPHHLD